MQYSDFYEFKEIGSGGYKTIYSAKYKYSEVEEIPETVILIHFKNYAQMLELFINGVSNYLYY